MKTSNKSVTLRRLTADKGMVLTQAQDTTANARTFGTEVLLADSDSAENWKEVTKEAAEEFKARWQTPLVHTEEEAPLNL